MKSKPDVDFFLYTFIAYKRKGKYIQWKSIKQMHAMPVDFITVKVLSMIVEFIHVEYLLEMLCVWFLEGALEKNQLSELKVNTYKIIGAKRIIFIKITVKLRNQVTRKHCWYRCEVTTVTRGVQYSRGSKAQRRNRSDVIGNGELSKF